jgi:hypothetical protein
MPADLPGTSIVSSGAATIPPVPFEDVTQQLIAEVVAHSQTSRETSQAPAQGLHVCAQCNSKLVYPTDGNQEGDGYWYIELRCPDCDWTSRGIFEHRMLDEFDRELDRGRAELAADLGRLAVANMFDYVDRFVSALNADGIHPIDF